MHAYVRPCVYLACTNCESCLQRYLAHKYTQCEMCWWACACPLCIVCLLIGVGHACVCVVDAGQLDLVTGGFDGRSDASLHCRCVFEQCTQLHNYHLTFYRLPCTLFVYLFILSSLQYHNYYVYCSLESLWHN